MKARRRRAEGLPRRQHGPPPAVKGGYFPVPPVDSDSDLRAEMLSTMGEMGLPIEKHHHEVAQSPARARHQVRPADHAWPTTCRSTSTASTTSPTATARPRPSCRSRSMATTARACTAHQSIWKAGKPLFAGNGYADLSETCLYYIGGIIKHAKAINAFTNPLDQQLQAPDPRLRGAGAAGLLGAQPLGLLPHSRTPPARRPSASRCGSPTRPPTRTWPSRRC